MSIVAPISHRREISKGILIQKHEVINFRYDRCEFTTTHKDQLREHTFSKHYQKKFKCIECSAEFSRNDNLAKHMKNHVDLSSEDPKQLCKDIKLSKDETSMHKRKDTHSNGLYESHKSLTVGDDTMKLENKILNSNHEYEQKRELWKKIYEIRRVLD